MQCEYLYHGGDDLAVVNAAKVSFNKRSTEIGKDEISLINFLAKGLKAKDREAQAVAIAHMTDLDDIQQCVEDIKMQAVHWTPFSHTLITMRVSAPVPIRTQFFKHKIGFTENEESRRYITSRPELFVPEYFREAVSDKKQGSGGKHQKSDYWTNTYVDHCQEAIDIYEEMLADGVCPEQARFILPQGVIVNWIWSGNLAAYARFFNQRTDSHAQKESQVLAKQIGELIQPLFPVSWSALTRKVS